MLHRIKYAGEADEPDPIVSRDGRRIVLDTSERALIWSTSNGNLIAEINLGNELKDKTGFTVSETGDKFATVYDEANKIDCRIWSVEKAKLIASEKISITKITDDERFIVDSTLTPYGLRIVARLSERKAYALLSLATGKSSQFEFPNRATELVFNPSNSTALILPSVVGLKDGGSILEELDEKLAR